MSEIVRCSKSPYFTEPPSHDYDYEYDAVNRNERYRKAHRSGKKKHMKAYLNINQLKNHQR